MNEVDVEAPNGERSPFDLSNSVHGDHTSMESDEELSDYEDDDDDEPTINTEAARKKFKNMKQTGSNTVYAVLALAAIGFSLATFFLLKSANEKKFKSEVRTNGVASKPNDKKDIFAKMPVYLLKLWLGFFLLFLKISIILQFQSYARETADIAENNANKIFGQLQSFATAITSVAIQTNNYGFPNVTVPHFDKRAQEIANLTGAEMIMFAPFVNQNEKEGWERYAVQHQDWISQDYVSLTLAPIVTCVPHLAKSHPLALSPTI